MMKDHRDRSRNKERNRESDYRERIIHDEEFGEENVELVDEEWAAFEKVLREFRTRRLLTNSMENINHRQRRSRRSRNQAFYPCPPSSISEADRYDYSDDEDGDLEDPDGYINTLVSILYTITPFACALASPIVQHDNSVARSHMQFIAIERNRGFE